MEIMDSFYNTDKFSVAENITEESISYFHKLIKIENDH